MKYWIYRAIYFWNSIRFNKHHHNNISWRSSKPKTSK